MSFCLRHWSTNALVAILIALTATGCRPEIAGAASVATPTAVEIVEQMRIHNQARAAGLKHLKSTRSYDVEYRGFSKTVTARMTVEYEFNASTGKSFRILTQSGSKLLLEKVVKRAIDSEKEASQDKTSTALTPANYRFHFAESENFEGRLTYVLNVEPIEKSKFLYRGKIWVDAADFALVKIEAEPAKNPSFWITRTLIRQSFTKTGNYWLPAKNRSETKVRVGGTAVMTIDYGNYQIE